MSLSHFDEASGIIDVQTEWGRWWQTVEEVFIEVNVSSCGNSPKPKVKIETNYIECRVGETIFFSGNLFKPVREQGCVWTFEDKKKISILLEKAEKFENENLWSYLLKDQYAADPFTQLEMMKKLDLEKFQMEHPGFNFSGAELSKTYNKPPDM